MFNARVPTRLVSSIFLVCLWFLAASCRAAYWSTIMTMEIRIFVIRPKRRTSRPWQVPEPVLGKSIDAGFTIGDKNAKFSSFDCKWQFQNWVRFIAICQHHPHCPENQLKNMQIIIFDIERAIGPICLCYIHSPSVISVSSNGSGLVRLNKHEPTSLHNLKRYAVSQRYRSRSKASTFQFETTILSSIIQPRCV